MSSAQTAPQFIATSHLNVVIFKYDKLSAQTALKCPTIDFNQLLNIVAHLATVAMSQMFSF